DGPRFGQTRRQLVAGHRLHEGIVHRIEDPERRDLADDLTGIEPHGRERHVEGPPHFTFGLILSSGSVEEPAREERDHQGETAERETSLVVHGLFVSHRLAYTAAPS